MPYLSTGFSEPVWRRVTSRLEVVGGGEGGEVGGATTACPAVETPVLVEMAARDLVLEHQHAPVQEQHVVE